MTDPCDSAIHELARDFGDRDGDLGILAKRLRELVVMARGFREDGGAIYLDIRKSKMVVDALRYVIDQYTGRPEVAAERDQLFALMAEVNNAVIALEVMRPRDGISIAEISAGGMTPYYTGDRATRTPSLHARVKFTAAARERAPFDVAGIWVVEDLLVGRTSDETIARLSKGNARARSDVRNLLPETYEETPNAHVARAHGAVEGLGGNASARRQTEPNEGDPSDCPGCGASHLPIEDCPPTDSIARPGRAFTVSRAGESMIVEVDGKRLTASPDGTYVMPVEVGDRIRMIGGGGSGGSGQTQFTAAATGRSAYDLAATAGPSDGVVIAPPTLAPGLERALSTPEGAARVAEIFKRQLRSPTAPGFVAEVSIRDGRYGYTCPACGDVHENISRGDEVAVCPPWPHHAIALVWPAHDFKFEDLRTDHLPVTAAPDPGKWPKREAIGRNTAAGGTMSFEVYPRCSVEDCGDSAVVNVKHNGIVSPVCMAHIEPITSGDSLVQEITVTVGDGHAEITDRRAPPQTSSMSFADLLRAPAVQRMLEQTTAEDAIKALAWCRDLTKDLPAVPERSPRDLRDLTPAEVVQRGIAALRQVGAGLTPGDAAKVADELAAIAWPEED